MDLLAYVNIPNLKSIAEINGIDVPRLRGYALMSEERVITREEIDRAILSLYSEQYEHMCTSCPRFRPSSDVYEFSSATDRLRRKYIIKETRTDTDAQGETYSYDHTVGFRWHLIHGKNRKALKFALKKAKRAVEHYCHTFNKYVGRTDVLRVHARIGGGNWQHYYGEVVGKPWFIEKVDDYFDNTYCDIFCKIDNSAE